MLIFIHTPHKSQTRQKPNRHLQNDLHGAPASFQLSYPQMDDLIKLVRTYRLTAGLAERIRLAEEICRRIEPDLRYFVFSSVSHHAAEDAMQEILKAVAIGMKKFEG